MGNGDSRYRALALSFQGPYVRALALNSRDGNCESELPEMPGYQERLKVGAELFRQDLLGDKQTITIHGLEKMAEELEKRNVVNSIAVGREMAPYLNGLRVPCENGGFLSFQVEGEDYEISHHEN